MATTIGRIRVREAGAGGGGTGLLSSWLTADPELEGLTVRREAAAGPPAGNAMGIGEDLVIDLATGLAVAALEAAFLQLLRSVYNQLRNRRRAGVTVTVEVGGDCTLTLESERQYTRGELTEMARRAAAAIDPE
ncbi:hypothetical protein N0X72_16110 [Streptomyces carpaticus]|uniref:effector-associated constant component EACC1 n=1 Tax=Streptomyces TaxID=1883 RepID=UPI002206E08D|nr:hypothetical protein N0X72_16110 [Streptomyces carpaticus]